MKLKKLEITGFKSFPEKAAIEFPPGISAIVGPNGCGKSNVIDALRWVMGEQSLKQLRGKHKEDIIFSGANGQAPLNMAEVSLTLHNDNGSAPEAFQDLTEIMVTRRLFRSGESAYLINRRPCRLKDIHHLFLGSGMGARSYAVIQQGNIGAITDAGPDERRVFIEEAAGVTRYKERKQEALRKIEATDQNLLRIRDIITEVQRQMTSLKRQAKKAERYRAQQEAIRGLDIRLGLVEDHRLAEQRAEAAALLQDRQDAELAHTTRLQRLDAAVARITLQRQEKDRAINALKARQHDGQRRIDRLESDLQHMRQDIQRLTAEIHALDNARQDLQGKNRTIDDEMDQVRAQHAALQARITGQRDHLNVRQKDLQSRRADLERTAGALEAAKTELMEKVTQEARTRNIHQNAATHRENITRRLKRIDEEVARTAQTVAAAEKRHREVTAELAEAAAALAELDDRLARQRAAVAQQSQRLGEQVKTVQTLDHELRGHTATVTSLKQMEEGLEWYRDGVKAVLKEARNAPDGPFTALLSDVLEVDPKFETALEAVLGESLQYVLATDRQAVADALARLRRDGAGRCGFICLDALAGERRAAAPAGAARLTDHVRSTAAHDGLLPALLDGVLVAEDLADALELAWRNDREYTVVTLAGDVVAGRGTIAGGSTDRLDGILAKKRQIKELSARIAADRERLAAARREQAEQEAVLHRQEQELHRSSVARQETQEEHLQLEKALYTAAEDLKNARRHHDIAQLEQEQLMGEQLDLAAEEDRARDLLQTITAEVAESRRAVACTGERIRQGSAELEALDREVVDLKLELTARQTEIQNHADTLHRLQAFKADGQARLDQVIADVADKTDKREALTARVREQGQALAELHEQGEALARQIDDQRRDFGQIDRQIRENDERMAGITAERDAVRQKIRVIELEQSQREIRQEAVAARLQERYQRTPAQLRRDTGWAPDGEPLDAARLQQRLAEMREKLSRFGDVNLSAIKEYEELQERHAFLSTQHDDLVKAVADLHTVVRRINRITQERFMATFDQINAKLEEVFPRLFNGGSARLVLTAPDQPLETGVEMMIHPPGKKLTRLSLLSGGEKALSAIAFIFAIFLIKPTSFCLMDEIDAPLDDANVVRFNNLLKLIGAQSQIIIVTHNKNSMEFADTLFGITMEKRGISKVVSVNLE